MKTIGGLAYEKSVTWALSLFKSGSLKYEMTHGSNAAEQTNIMCDKELKT